MMAHLSRLATRKLLKVARRSLGDQHDDTIRAANMYAEALCMNPEASRADALEAEALLASSVKAMRITLGPQHPRTINTTNELTDLRRFLSQSAAS